MLNDRPCIVNLISSRNTGHPLSLQLPQLGEVFYRDQLTPEAAAKLGPSVDVLVGASNLKVPKSELNLYPNLKMVADFGVGYDGFDTAEIIRRGLRFSHTPDVLSEDTADLGLALLLDVTRRVAQGDAFIRRGDWPKKNFPLGRRLFGKKLGIAGLGRIGSVIAQRSQAFRMEVGYTSRSPKNVPWQRFPDMKALAQWCDFLIVVIPGSPETHHLVNAEVLDALGPQGYLVNIARGALVDTDALIKALKEHRIAGAALDVFEHEPHVEEGLIALDNVVLTPHQGSATVETRADMADLVMRNIQKALSGQAVITPVPGTRKD